MCVKFINERVTCEKVDIISCIIVVVKVLVLLLLLLRRLKVEAAELLTLLCIYSNSHHAENRVLLSDTVTCLHVKPGCYAHLFVNFGLPPISRCKKEVKVVLVSLS